MQKIEQGLQKVHKFAGGASHPEPPSTSSNLQEVFLLEPFLRVNLVSSGSPAELAVRILNYCLCIIFLNLYFVLCNI